MPLYPSPSFCTLCRGCLFSLSLSSGKWGYCWEVHCTTLLIICFGETQNMGLSLHLPSLFCSSVSVLHYDLWLVWLMTVLSRSLMHISIDVALYTWYGISSSSPTLRPGRQQFQIGTAVSFFPCITVSNHSVVLFLSAPAANVGFLKKRHICSPPQARSLAFASSQFTHGPPQQHED